MSEEQENDGTWSGLKKTIIGTISTAILAGGTYVTTQLFGGGDEESETKTEQVAPAPVIVNVQQNQENKQKVENGGGTIIRERVIEKPAASTEPAKPAKPAKQEEESW